jgi:hypothetical protein
MGNIIPDSYLPPPSQPWGREMTNRLEQLESRFDAVLNDTSTSIGAVSSTINFLSGMNTFYVSDETISSTTDKTGNSILLKTLTLDFTLTRDSYIMFSSRSRTSGAAVSAGQIATFEAFTSLTSTITLDSVNTVATGQSGSGNTINSTYVRVDDLSDHMCYGYAKVNAGSHTAVINIYSLIRATGTASFRNIFSSNLMAQVVG